MAVDVAVEQLRVTFDGQEHPAVDGVDLEVSAGEVAAILGPSGCGKTTLLRVVAGLQAPDAGRVRLGGIDVTRVPPHQRGVGLMFQDHALFPHRDVGTNVAFGLRMARWPAARRRARVAEVLELVGLAGWEKRAIGPLSGGERQRVALARALAPSPDVLLLDEPLGALDRALRDRLIPELRQLFDRVGTTVVYVTHDQAEALALADQVVVMDAGHIVQQGTPRDVWARPATPFVARFLGFANVTDEQVVRPDAVRLARADASFPSSSDAEPGVVEAVVFKGEHTEVRVRSARGALVASLPTATAPVLAAGDQVDVTIDPTGVVPFAPLPADPDPPPGQ